MLTWNGCCLLQGKLYVSFEVQFPKDGQINAEAAAMLVKVFSPCPFAARVVLRSGMEQIARRPCVCFAR